MNFLKEILYGNPDRDYIHQKFIKYSRGEFDGPAITVKKTGNSIKIIATSEYSDIIGWILAKNSDNDLKVSGSIISKNLDEVGLQEYGIKPAKIRKKSGTFTFEITGIFSSGSISKVYEELKDSSIFFDISSENGNLKTKKKPPRPGSGTDTEFCSASLNSSVLKDIVNEILFDTDTTEFKEINPKLIVSDLRDHWSRIKISHKYRIRELIIPEEYKNDPTKARLKAKRKGSILRIFDIDGGIVEKESDLLV